MDEFYEIEYTGRIDRTDRIFDTTDEELAKEERIFNPRDKYGSRIITRENELVEGLIEQVKEMEEGEEREVEVPINKAYGKRDPRNVDLVPKSDFEKTDVTPLPGLTVLLDGNPAKIQTVSGGRVRVDFNNPLAGKDLNFHVKLVKKFTEDKDKVKAILMKILPLKEEDIEIKEKKKKAVVSVPENVLGEDKDQARKLLSERIKKSTEYEKVEVEGREKVEEDEEKEETGSKQ